MNIDNFLQEVERSEIANHKKFLCEVVRPAFDIVKNNDEVTKLGCSRFGGSPDLPVGCKWPMYDTKPYRFLGQINFAEITSNDTLLPSSGLLCLFAADNPDDDCYIEPFEDGYIHAIFIPELKDIEKTTPPNAVVNESISIEFIPTLDMPYDEYQLKDWPFSHAENDIYSDLRSSLHKSSDYLLGNPSHCTLAYDPTPGPEWISLLTVDSDGSLEWCWHDGDKLMIFIERERLKNLDFSCLKADAG